MPAGRRKPALSRLGGLLIQVGAPVARHPVIRSFEPGEDWFWSYTTDEFYDSGPALAPPESHPTDQPVPGPAGRVPRDWRAHLN